MFYRHLIVSVVLVVWGSIACAQQQTRCPLGSHKSGSYCCPDGSDYSSEGTSGLCCPAGTSYMTDNGQHGTCCPSGFENSRGRCIRYYEGGSQGTQGSIVMTRETFWKQYANTWFQVQGQWIQITTGGFLISGKFHEYTAGGIIVGGSTIVISGSGQITVDGRPVQISTTGPATGAGGGGDGQVVITGSGGTGVGASISDGSHVSGGLGTSGGQVTPSGQGTCSSSCGR